jgi:hypothetical protein
MINFSELEGKPTRAKWDKLIALLPQLRVIAGMGVRVSETNRGLLLHVPKTRAAAAVAGCQDLLAYLEFDPETELWSVGVSPGFSDDLVPTIDDAPLTESPAPMLSVTAATTLWLKITWRPAFLEDEGGFYMVNGGEAVTAEFILAAEKPELVLPAVDEESGAITDGEFHKPWAYIYEDGAGGYQIGGRCGNHQLSFCEPQTLTMLWDHPTE